MKHLYTILLGGCCFLCPSTSKVYSLNPSPLSVSYYGPISANFISHLLYQYLNTENSNCDDDDKDGVCNIDDCAPFNPNIPAKPGTPCDDNIDFTINDKIQADGCSCIGTNTIKDMPITISLGEDRQMTLNETLTISTSVIQHNTCITTSCEEEAMLIGYWNMDNCKIEPSTGSATANATFFPTILKNDFCANIVTKKLVQPEGTHYCIPNSYSARAKDAMTFEMPVIESFQNKHPKSLQFEVILDTKEEASKLNKITFMQRTIDKVKKDDKFHNNNSPTRYGLRILKGGTEIYKSLDMPTAKRWTEAIFDFSNEPIFEIESSAVFTVELLAYGADPANGDISMWTIDDFRIFGSCCNTTSFQSSKYLWSTGDRTNTIKVSQPGDYIVTVTDCNGTTAADQVKVSLIESGN